MSLSVGAVFTAEHRKTANRNSIINFYFVTAFYRLDDICMVEYRKTWFFRQEDMKTFDITKHPKTSRLQSPACLSFLHTYYYTDHVALRRLG